MKETDRITLESALTDSSYCRYEMLDLGHW